jgi:beta-mannanase
MSKVTTQSPLTGTGAIQSPLVGTGTFQSNSPVGDGSVHDIHASNININAQARTEMLSNPFMWMFNMPNQQDFWKDFVDKRVQEALNPTLLRSAAMSATFKYQPLNSGLDFHYPHYHSWTLTGYEPKLKTRTRFPRHPHNHYYWRTCQTYV